MRCTARALDRRQGGSVLLETALVVPLLLLFVLGAVDLGLWVLETTLAASSARDGARVGILSYSQADLPGSNDAAAVRAAVQRRIGGHLVSTQIRCVGPMTTASQPCASASVLTPDRIEVQVSWPRSGLSFVTKPFGATSTVSGKAVMRLNGVPTAVPPP